MNFVELALIFGGALVAGGLVLPLRRHFALRLVPRTSLVAAVAIIGLWTAVVGGLAIAQHLAFHSHAYDLAIFDQVVWNSAQGRLFENSVMADSPSFLGHHFSPILLVLVPLYWLYPDPVVLLAAQSLLLGLAGLPLFLFARDRLGPGLALAILGAYLLHPATAAIALFDFHEVALAVPLLALALYFLMRLRYRGFAAVSLVAMLVKEDIGLIVAAMGLYLALAQRQRIAGLLCSAAGIVWTLALMRFVIPAFHPSGQYFFSALYADLGGGALDIALAPLRDPGAIISRLIAPGKQLYLQQLFAPLAALPLLGWPVLAIAAPTLLYLLVGRFPDNLIQNQYSAPLLAPLLFALAAGLAGLRDRAKPYWETIVPALTVLVAVAAILGAYLYGPLPFARGFQPEKYRAEPRLAAARALIAAIPPEASVIAQSDLVPQLSRRRAIQAFGLADPAFRPDFYLFDTDSRSSRYPLGYEDQPYFAALARVTSDAGYRIVAEQQGYLLLRRVVPEWEEQLSVVFGDQIELVGYRLVTRDVAPGGRVELELYWRATSKPAADYSVFIHLLDGEGRGRGQRDTYPVGERYPTATWEPGRLLRGEYVFPVAPDAAPGDYRLLVGLYDLKTMQRLPRSALQEQPGDAVTITGPTVRRP